MSWRPSSTFWKISTGEIRRRPGRALLTLLGIVIGVAATVAISVCIQTTRQAHRQMFDEVAGRAALEVVAEGLGGFDPNLAVGVESVPGVKAAVPVIQAPAALTGKSGPVPVMVLGVDPARDAAAREFTLRRGRLLGDGVMLEAGFADSQGIDLGHKVRFLASTGFTTLPVVGLLEPRGAAAFNGGAVAVMPLATAQRLFGLTDRINSLQLVLEDGASQSQVEAEVGRRLPTGLMVQTPGTRGELGRTGMVSTEQGLSTLSASSLVAGAFVILNAFLMNLGERRRQLAVLRALGATRSQVTRLVLREAAFLGVVGTGLGIGAGLALAVSLRRVIGQLLTVTLPDLRLTAEPFLIALVLGPGMALAATYIPARRAGRRAFLEDLLGKGGRHADKARRWFGFVGLVLLAGILTLLIGLARGWLSVALFEPFIAPAMATYLIACVLLIPLLLDPLTRLAAWLLKAALGQEGGLAVRQLVRHRTRTTLTVGVLLVAVVFAIGFGQSLVNGIDHIRFWFRHIIATDFYVRAAWPDPTVNITTATIPEGLADEVAHLDHVRRADKFSFVLARAAGRPVVVLASTTSPDGPAQLAVAEGDPVAIKREVLQGAVVLGTALAHRLGVHRGDSITLETRHGPRTLPIAGTAAEYTGGGMAIYMEWYTAKRFFDLKGVHALLVSARPGETAALAETLKAFCGARSLLYQSNLEVRRTFDQQMSGLLGFIWILLSLVFVVASLGVVNTLTMNVLDQTRELGVLRAIGMKRSQVGKLVLAQALALGTISLVPGALGGILLAFLVNLSTYPLTGQPVPFHLDGWQTAGCLGGALVIATLAALVPARRAARLAVIQALQYE